MPRLFFGNFSFEHELADPHFQPSKSLIQQSAQWGTIWMNGASADDLFWLSSTTLIPLAGPTKVKFISTIDELLTYLHKANAHYQFVPWGWSPRALAHYKMLPTCYVDAAPPPLDVVRYGNSRRFAFEMEQQFGSVLTKGQVQYFTLTTCISTSAELEEWNNRVSGSAHSWVIKAEFGMSGRERILGQQNLRPEQTAWCLKRLAMGQHLFAEPWLKRIEEVGIQWHIEGKDQIRLVGITRLECSPTGQYQSSSPLVDPDSIALWQPAIDHQFPVVQKLANLGYTGPLGIDAMRYLPIDSPNADTALRPFQDINARWTMGRLALG